MQILHTLDVDSPLGPSQIVLLWGNLVEAGPTTPVDILVVSTFPNDYTPTPTSLVGDLSFRGVNMAELARDKEKDLGPELGAWLSRDIRPLRAGVNVRRILCIEGSNAPRLFRALVATLAGEANPVTVAMPVIGTGDQGYEFDEVFPSILEAAHEWIVLGLPVRRLEIVIRNQKIAQHAAVMFEQFAARRRMGTRYDRSPERRTAPRFDVFLSYAHKDAGLADILLQALEGCHARVFMDRKDLSPGVIWQQEIYRELDGCRRIVSLLSANYIESDMCVEEFNIAMIRRRSERKDLLVPVYVRTASLPSYMQLVQWIDCREGNETKLRAAAARVLDSYP